MFNLYLFRQWGLGRRPLSAVSDSEYIYSKEIESAAFRDGGDDENAHSKWDWGAIVTDEERHQNNDEVNPNPISNAELEPSASQNGSKVPISSQTDPRYPPDCSLGLVSLFSSTNISSERSGETWLSASLCGADAILNVGRKTEARQVFDEHIVPVELFLEDPHRILANPKAIFREEDRYYTWQAILPSIMGSLLYHSCISVYPLVDYTTPNTTTLNGGSDFHKAGSSWDKGIGSAAGSLTNPADTSRSWKWWGKPRNEQTKTPSDQNTVHTQHSHTMSDTTPLHSGGELSRDNPTKPPPTKKQYAKTLRLTPSQLASLNLKLGINKVTFKVKSNKASSEARIFLYNSSTQIVVSDIDGTITK